MFGGGRGWAGTLQSIALDAYPTCCCVVSACYNNIFLISTFWKVKIVTTDLFLRLFKVLLCTQISSLEMLVAASNQTFDRTFTQLHTVNVHAPRQNVCVCIYVCIYIWLDFRKGYRQLQAQCPEYPPPPPLFPNFPVPSSYKNGNCLNIRTSLDILDNIHPRK